MRQVGGDIAQPQRLFTKAPEVDVRHSPVSRRSVGSGAPPQERSLPRHSARRPGRVGERRVVGKAFDHGLRRVEAIVVVGAQVISCLVEGRVQPRAGEQVVDLTLFRFEVVDVAGCDRVHTELCRQCAKIPHQVGLAWTVMTLKLDEEVVMPEDPTGPSSGGQGARCIAREDRPRYGAVTAAGERDQVFVVCHKVLRVEPGGTLGLVAVR